MTVKELITELNKIEDKNKVVKVYSDGCNLNVLGIYETINVYFKLEPIEIDWEDCL